MRVSSIMTPYPVSVAADATLDHAMHLMDAHGIRHLPVVEVDRLVGVFSDRDLMEATGWLPDEQARTVADIMNRDVKAVDPQTELVSVSVEIMMDRVGSLAVVQNGLLIGMVTETDLMRAYVRAEREGLLTVADHDPQVSERMVRNLITAEPPTPTYMDVKAALDLCVKRRVRHLPVVQDGRLLGIVSDRDLRRALARRQDPTQLFEHAISRQTITISPNETVLCAARLMLEHKISALPVVSEGALAGLVTATDLVSHCMDTLWEPESFSRP